MKLLVTHCKECNILFGKAGQNHKFCSESCQKKAHKEQSAIWTNTYKVKKPEKQMLRSARFRAKRKGIPFDIDDSDVFIPTHCPILGIPLRVNIKTGAGGKDDSYSLDRIDPSKGYVKGNVQVISHKANSMKFTATSEELKRFADWIYKTYE